MVNIILLSDMKQVNKHASQFSFTYHGPIPIFGMAVGAMIPFTSC